MAVDRWVTLVGADEGGLDMRVHDWRLFVSAWSQPAPQAMRTGVGFAEFRNPESKKLLDAMLANRSITISADPKLTQHKTPVTVIWKVSRHSHKLAVRRGIERIRWLLPEQQVCWTKEIADQLVELRQRLG